MIKIAHLADIHMRLRDRHEEYEEVFEKLYVELKKKSPDVILLAGDIVHSKTVLSPELVVMLTKFLVSLDEIAPVHMIAGNHDMNMANADRLDSLTPIVEGLPNINYHTETGLVEIPIGDKVLGLGIYSLLDGKTYKLKKTQKKDNGVYVAMYHGAIAGCKLDNNYIPTNVATSIRAFTNFDFGMFGDIHLRQFLNKNETFAYCGSLIQQNFGETLGKGFLYWEIDNKDSFTCDFVPIHNDYGYYTFKADMTDKTWMDVEEDIPEKCRMRVVIPSAANEMSKSLEAEIKSMISMKYNPTSLTVTHRPNKEDLDLINVGDKSININSYEVQRDLLSDWLDKDVNKDDVLELDKLIFDKVSVDEGKFGSTWSLKKISIENFMSFGEKTTIDFEDMDGIIGLFGQNAAGKSVIIDAIVYGLFSKITRKVDLFHVVNKLTENNTCTVVVELEIQNIDYRLTRSTKATVTTAGKPKTSTSLSLESKGLNEDEWIDCKEDSKRETEAIIVASIGTYDDFVLTTLSKQGKDVEFIDLLPAQRMDNMIKFLGLDIFSLKYDCAKEETKTLEKEYKELTQDVNLEVIGEKSETLESLNKEISDLQSREDVVLDKISKLRDELVEHSSNMNNDVSVDKSADEYEKELKVEVDKLNLLKEDMAIETTRRDSFNRKLIEINNAHLLTDDKFQALSDLSKKSLKYSNEIRGMEYELSSNLKVLKVYREEFTGDPVCPVQYDENHAGCVFVTKRVDKLKECDELVDDHTKLIKEKDELVIKNDLISYSVDALEEQNSIRGKLALATTKLGSMDTSIADIGGDVEVKEMVVTHIKGKQRVALENEETLLRNIQLIEKSDGVKQSIEEEESELRLIRHWKTDKTRNSTLLTKEVEDLIKLKERTSKLFNEVIIHRLYCKAMHRDGIPITVIHNYMNKLNYEINDILIDCIDFGVNVHVNEHSGNIDISMRYDGDVDDTRPVQMASGMEKLLINFAIRYALISVSNINKPNTWFIDEGFGVLDQDNLTAMEMLFANMNTVFKNIVIITHIDQMKDVATHIINVSKKDGISQVTIQN
jgi:DNA repair exonuclease SbcCD ATPase subunit/DNA repair exonuclease SbcCD nuclease subunit